MLQAAAQAGINFPFYPTPLIKPPPCLPKHCCKNYDCETATLVHDYLLSLYLQPAAYSPLSASLDKPRIVSFIFTTHPEGHN